MATFVMVFAAGMAMGDAPNRVSAAVEQPLDVGGQWEGTWQTDAWVPPELR
jgi:hypothetical protein